MSEAKLSSAAGSGDRGGRVCVDAADNYKPGDMPPEGYLQWHEWAEVQRKAGIKQAQCGSCSLWRTPQELSDKKITMVAKDSKGNAVQMEWPVCTKCAEAKAL